MTHSEPEHHTFTSQRLALSYASWGKADAPLLILVHGGRDQKRSWDWVAREIAADYHVIAHDLRGHGQSDWVSDGDYGVMDHVFDLASLVRHCAGETPRPFTLIGHSLGGNIAVRYAGLFPEHIRQLVAIEGLGPSPAMLEQRHETPPEARLRDWVEQRTKLSSRSARKMADLATAEDRMRAAHSHLSAEQIAHLTRHGVRRNGDDSFSWCYDPAGMGRSPADIPHTEFQHLWGRIACPTWLVYGADSWASNPERDGRATGFRNATVTEIPGASHWAHHDQFDLFMDGLKAFLQPVDA